MGLGAAREKVRVAHRLAERPQIDQAFAAGEFSYSKVRAMTRVATPKNQAHLVGMARQTTAAQLEKLCRKLRGVLQIEGSAEVGMPAGAQGGESSEEAGGESRGEDRDSRAPVRPPVEAVVHISAEDLAGHTQDGAGVSAETSRRLLCDSGIVPLLEDRGGEVLDVGRKTRRIPPALRRALQARDGGCQFPGCDRTRLVDAHHVAAA